MGHGRGEASGSRRRRERRGALAALDRGERPPPSSWTGRVTGAALALAVAAAAGAATPAPAAERHAKARQGIVSKAVAKQPRAVRRYWTPARMRAAEPTEPPSLPPTATPSGGPAAPEGPPTVVPPAAPGEDGAAELERGTAAAGAASHTQVRRTQVADPTSFPSRTHGKLFFTLGGEDFLCSATAVSSPNHSVVITAGHCTFDSPDGGSAPRFATNWAFAPAYRDGQRPLGVWVARRLAVTGDWDRNPLAANALRFDVGAAVVHRDANGRGIQDVVGGRGIGFNQPRNQAYEAFGYPAVPVGLFGPRFDGERPFRCDSGYGGDDTFFTAPRPMRVACDMTEGSSGGGWVAGGEAVLAVSSYKIAGEPDHLYGPYFGDQAEELYRSVRGRELTCRGLPATQVGTAGADELVGTPGPDVIKAGGGDDVIRGLEGNDRICVGGGDDEVRGGAGRDEVSGGQGADLLRGGRGGDRLNGGGGRDVLRGGRGRRDSCNGGRGRDRAPGCEARTNIP